MPSVNTFFFSFCSFYDTSYTVNSSAEKKLQFPTANWTNNRPLYPLTSIHEPQGLLIGNDIIIFAGFINQFTNVTNATYAKDIRTLGNAWRRMDDMPLPIGITHMPQALIGTKVYMCGGYVGGVPGPHSPLCFVYDHSIPPGRQNQWSSFPNLPNNGTAGAGMIYDAQRNALYYAGGAQRPQLGSKNAIDLNSTWKYSFDNPSAGWVASTPIPYTANHLSSVTHTNSITGKQRHFFMGGQVEEYEAQRNVADNFEFVASTETWVRRASMPLARGHAPVSTRSFGCGIVIAGGSINSPNNTKLRTDDISYYDVLSDQWTANIGTIPATAATPVVDIDQYGYMHFVANKFCVRRQLSL
jgi:hypothetical protein